MSVSVEQPSTRDSKRRIEQGKQVIVRTTVLRAKLCPGSSSGLLAVMMVDATNCVVSSLPSNRHGVNDKRLHLPKATSLWQVYALDSPEIFATGLGWADELVAQSNATVRRVAGVGQNSWMVICACPPVSSDGLF